MPNRTCTYRNPHNTLCCTECNNSIELCQCVNPDLAAYERMTSIDGLVFMMIRDELKAARTAFPGATHMLCALMEEVGELSQALMEHDRNQGTSVQEVMREAVQVATMAIRVAVEGDENFMYEFPIVEEKMPTGPVGRQYD
ncbi:MAG TPA: hypothetical protein VMW50_01010 [Dehalococcoidia bacterium]|nr:hypothetical protein [Dehalococcoidia bacterium]